MLGFSDSGVFTMKTSSGLCYIDIEFSICSCIDSKILNSAIFIEIT